MKSSKVFLTAIGVLLFTNLSIAANLSPQAKYLRDQYMSGTPVSSDIFWNDMNRGMSRTVNFTCAGYDGDVLRSTQMVTTEMQLTHRGSFAQATMPGFSRAFTMSYESTGMFGLVDAYNSYSRSYINFRKAQNGQLVGEWFVVVDPGFVHHLYYSYLPATTPVYAEAYAMMYIGCHKRN